MHDLKTKRSAREHQAVAVSAPARLHLGFFDLHGGMGRRFGGIGLTLEDIATRIVLADGARDRISGPWADRARAFVDGLRDAWNVDVPLDLRIEAAIPEHAGLGSGTQLGLAIGLAMARLLDLPAGPRDVAMICDRGARSGIGVGAFETGGVIVDGGKGGSDDPPPAVARLPFPPDWRVLLVFDEAHAGLHGPAELQAFEDLPLFPASTAAHLCRLVLMQLLPALAEADIDAFGAAVTELQRTVGDHFAPVQGGRYASAAVAEALAWLETRGAAGVGQSSWGPTGFAIVKGADEGRQLLAAAQQRLGTGGTLHFRLCRGRNRGGEIERLPEHARPLGAARLDVHE